MTSVTYTASVAAGIDATWSTIIGHPDLLLDMMAPDLVAGTSFDTCIADIFGGTGFIETVDAPRRVRLTWKPAIGGPSETVEWDLTGDADRSEVTVTVASEEGEPDATGYWRRSLDAVARLTESGVDRAPEGSVKAVLFDADGVLQSPTDGWLEEFERIGGPGFTRAAFELEGPTISGEGDLRVGLRELLASRGGNPDDVDAVLAAWHRFEVDPAAMEVIAGLRRAGYLVVLASNQQKYRGLVMRERGMDDHFDHTFYSFEVGAAKPSPAYFEHILDELGLDPKQAVFIDDMAANVLAARKVGLNAERHRWADGAPGLVRALARHGVTPTE